METAALRPFNVRNFFDTGAGVLRRFSENETRCPWAFKKELTTRGL